MAFHNRVKYLTLNTYAIPTRYAIPTPYLRHTYAVQSQRIEQLELPAD